MQKLKAAIIVCGLGAFLIMVAPAPAHADLSISSLFSGLMSGLQSLGTSLMNALTGNAQTTSSAVVGTGQLLNNTIIKANDAAATNANTVGQNIAGTIVATNAQDVPDAACQIAANAMDEGQRKQAEDDAARNLASVLAGLYNTSSSGTLLGKDKIINALCQLGATGKNGRCTVQGKPGLEGSDRDVTLAVIKNSCVPYDQNKIEAEFKKLQDLPDGGTYSISDPDMTAMMIAMLSIRVNRALSVNARPLGRETESISGHDIEAEHTQMVSQLLASDEPLLRALFWNTCFSTAMLPNCQTTNSKLITLLKNNNTPNMPSSNYCISYTQKNQAEVYQFQEMLVNIGDLAGQPPDTVKLAMDYRRAIRDNRRDHETVMKEASDAAKTRPDDLQTGSAVRPTTTDNDIRELKDSIRKLTRAIEQTNQRYPKAQDARLTAPSEPGELPPLRQDFPVVP